MHMFTVASRICSVYTYHDVHIYLINNIYGMSVVDLLSWHDLLVLVHSLFRSWTGYPLVNYIAIEAIAITYHRVVLIYIYIYK